MKRVHVAGAPFSVENRCLTPTLKIRRREVARRYAAEIRALYEAGDPGQA